MLLCLQVLRVVLSTGNMLNAGTNRGNAESIKLDVLLKLNDVKVTAQQLPPLLSADATSQAAPAAAGAAGGGDSELWGLLDRPPHVKTLLEFVAWVVLREGIQVAAREAAAAAAAAAAASPTKASPRKASSSASPSKLGRVRGAGLSTSQQTQLAQQQLARTARTGFLSEDLSSLQDAVRRMQTGMRKLTWWALKFRWLAAYSSAWSLLGLVSFSKVAPVRPGCCCTKRKW